MLGTILIFSKRTGTRVGAALLSAVLVLGACGGDAAAPPDLTIVATTSIAGDLVSQVVGDDAIVEVLMPIGTDPHDFQPSSQQVATLRSADLVVAWGLDLEEGLEDVLASASEDGIRVLEISALVDPIEFSGGDDDHADDEHADDEHADDEHADDEHADDEHADDEHADDEHADDEHADDEHADDEHADDEHAHGGLDPHTWMDPVRMADALRLIGVALSEVAPGEDWTERASQAADEMLEVHEEVESILAAIPHERRKLVTNHDSFGYLAARYDFEIVGVAIPGGSTLASPSSAQISELVEVIRETGVEVLFAETTSPAALLEAIAGEVEGVRVVELLEASLAPPGEPGDTLAGMLVVNAETIAEALGS